MTTKTYREFEIDHGDGNIAKCIEVTETGIEVKKQFVKRQLESDKVIHQNAISEIDTLLAEFK